MEHLLKKKICTCPCSELRVICILSVFKILIFNFLIVFGLAVWLAGSEFPDQGLNKPMPLALKAQTPNHWAAGEIPVIFKMLF